MENDNQTPEKQAETLASVDVQRLVGPVVVPFSLVPDVGTTWWHKDQKQRDYMAPYYEVINSSDAWVTIQFHHCQREDMPHGITPKYFRSNYERRDDDMESINTPD